MRMTVSIQGASVNTPFVSKMNALNCRCRPHAYPMGIQTALYDVSMPMKQTSLRLSSVHRSQLAKLAQKLQIDQANVIRLAITRLAEAEGVLQTKSARND